MRASATDSRYDAFSLPACNRIFFYNARFFGKAAEIAGTLLGFNGDINAHFVSVFKTICTRFASHFQYGILSFSIEPGMTATQKDKIKVISTIVLNLILFSPVLWLFLKLAAEKIERYGNYDEFKEFS